MDPTRRLPPRLVERARAYLDGSVEVARPRDASTVVLLRDTSDGPQVYLLRRQPSMAFAGGMYAFPGGSVDPRDADRAVGWVGPQPSAWADRLGCDEPLARALVCAAVRETFEEAGVLLAGPSADRVVADTTGEGWERDRQALVDHSLAFADLLHRRGLVLRTDLLAAWAHWITPEFEPRRYDTRFFVALLPTGQRTRDVSGEADHVLWSRPGDAVAQVGRQQISMLPPTYATLRELAEHATADAVLRAAPSRSLPTVVPRVEVVDGEGYLTVPQQGG